ncbi:HAAS signaling domain-containing protein [Streptomyces sp. NPDC101490]|uniref:HAAS signaling domain-containing protein n=1 Tax=Streptomyces sp. NPDC101490 TaxID=3366143 RepID=UPI003803E36F
MNAVDHPLVAAYLDAVGRETTGLPAERRAELLADLREHIEVNGVDGGTDDDRVRAVLSGLGDPRTVAASALSEEGVPGAAPTASRTGRVLALLSGSGLLLVLAPFLGAAVLIGTLFLLWRAPQWERREKIIGTVTGAAVPVLLFLGVGLGASGRIGPTELLLVAVFGIGVPVLGSVLLWRAVRR